jgi:hypothetical protein
VSRQARIGQRIAAFVLERGTNQRWASLARQGVERCSIAARVRVERGKLRAPPRAWIRRQLLDSSGAVSVVRFSPGLVAVHPPLELRDGARHPIGAKRRGQDGVAEGIEECRVRLPRRVSGGSSPHRARPSDSSEQRPRSDHPGHARKEGASRSCRSSSRHEGHRTEATLQYGPLLLLRRVLVCGHRDVPRYVAAQIEIERPDREIRLHLHEQSP